MNTNYPTIIMSFSVSLGHDFVFKHKGVF